FRSRRSFRFVPPRCRRSRRRRRHRGLRRGGVAVADGFLRDAIADALLDVLGRSERRLASLFDQLLVWLRRAAEPPRGLELRSNDGAMFSGVALFERNSLVAMLAVRHPQEEARLSRSEHQRAPEYPHDGPLWRERPTYR